MVGGRMRLRFGWGGRCAKPRGEGGEGEGEKNRAGGSPIGGYHPALRRTCAPPHHRGARVARQRCPILRDDVRKVPEPPRPGQPAPLRTTKQPDTLSRRHRDRVRRVFCSLLEKKKVRKRVSPHPFPKISCWGLVHASPLFMRVNAGWRGEEPAKNRGINGEQATRRGATFNLTNIVRFGTPPTVFIRFP